MLSLKFVEYLKLPKVAFYFKHFQVILNEFFCRHEQVRCCMLKIRAWTNENMCLKLLLFQITKHVVENSFHSVMKKEQAMLFLEYNNHFPLQETANTWRTSTIHHVLAIMFNNGIKGNSKIYPDIYWTHFYFKINSVNSFKYNHRKKKVIVLF